MAKSKAMSVAVYLMAAYTSEGLLTQLRGGFAKAGKKLDIGKSCIHFKSADELPLAAIGDIVASMPMREWISIFEASRRK